MGAEETLRIALSDDASAPAGVAVAALDRLDAALAKLDGKEVDIKTGGISAATVALNRLRTQAGAAGSAMAAFNAGLDPGKIGAATAAATKLSSVFDLMKNRANEARAAERRMFDELEARGSKTPTALQPGAAGGPVSGFQKLVGVVNSLFGAKAAGGFVEGAGALARASDKLGPLGPVLAGGGRLLAIGAAAAAAAAVALAAAAAVVAYKLLEAGLKLSIAATSTRESFEASVKRFVGGAKEAHEIYSNAIKVAVDLSLDKEETLKKAKALAGIGFKGAEVNVILRARADIATSSEEKADAFQKLLEKWKSGNGGKAFALEGIAEAGLNSDVVLQKLSEQLGVKVDKVKELLKAGKIDVQTGMQAIIAAAQGQYGGAAGNAADTVTAKFQSLSTLLESMFDGVDLSGIKAALDSVMKVLSGPDGEKLKGAVNKLFGSISDVFGKAFAGPEGEARLSRIVNAVAKAMEGAAIIIEKAGPKIVEIIDGVSKVFDRNGSTTGGSWLLSIFEGLQGLDFSTSLNDVILSAYVALEGFKASLFGMGADMISGLVNGLTSGASRVVDALVGAVNSAIAAANKALGRKSPAKATHDMGVDVDKGFEGGVASRLNQVKASGATMALAALSGAGTANDNASAAGGAAATRGGRAAGGNVTIVVQVQAGPGTTREQAQAAGDAAGEGAYRAWRRNMDRYVDDEERAA